MFFFMTDSPVPFFKSIIASFRLLAVTSRRPPNVALWRWGGAGLSHRQCATLLAQCGPDCYASSRLHRNLTACPNLLPGCHEQQEGEVGWSYCSIKPHQWEAGEISKFSALCKDNSQFIDYTVYVYVITLLSLLQTASLCQSKTRLQLFQFPLHL